MRSEVEGKDQGAACTIDWRRWWRLRLGDGGNDQGSGTEAATAARRRLGLGGERGENGDGGEAVTGGDGGDGARRDWSEADGDRSKAGQRGSTDASSPVRLCADRLDAPQAGARELPPTPHDTECAPASASRTSLMDARAHGASLMNAKAIAAREGCRRLTPWRMPATPGGLHLAASAAVA
ncbi:hypothetical protein PR202_gb20725 [Eleusine coracana subsp. coracana]|uniref:Uncharacterized protein n=1 Tax=Eleusine coracana subsp. coracana TaxID=191504 RepID=A0AAV5F985_ELECO|nr:hypothetical protein PR202_gb20725 [Eleusine coracana subsp. coracana]